MSIKTPKNDIRSSIMEKISHEKPTPKNWYIVTNWSRLILVFLLAILAGFIFGFYILELSENFETVTNFNLGLLLFSNSFFELALISFLISVILYFIYRQTDWFLVSHKWAVFFGIWVLIFIISIITIVFLVNNQDANDFYQDTKIQAKMLPIRRERLDNIVKRQKEIGFINGKIVAIKVVDKNTTILEIENPVEISVLEVEPQIIKNLNVGDFVRVRLDENNSKKVLEIKKTRRPAMMNFIKPSVIF